MSNPKKIWSDADMQLYLSRLLRYGIVLASATVLAGGITFLTRNGSIRPEYSSFIGEPEKYRSVQGIISTVGEFNGRGLIQFGLLILIAIPILRVAFSVVSFAFEKDRAYVGITLLVLALLLFSLFGQY